jgi:hypothetical protein
MTTEVENIKVSTKIIKGFYSVVNYWSKNMSFFYKNDENLFFFVN